MVESFLNPAEQAVKVLRGLHFREAALVQCKDGLGGRRLPGET